MVRVYDEFLQKHHHWPLVLNAIVEVAAEWNPDKIKSTRDAINEINGGGDIGGLNKEIAEKSAKLAELLRKRDARCDQLGLYPPHSNNIVPMMHLAAKIAGPNKEKRYTTHVDPELKKLYMERRNRGEGYWPNIHEILDALAQMQNGKATPLNDRCVIALNARETSVRSFWQVLEVAILQCYVSDMDGLPFFGKSAQAIADVLGLSEEMTPWLWLSHNAFINITRCALGSVKGVTKKSLQEYRKRESKPNR